MTGPLRDDIVALSPERARSFLPALYAGAIIVAALYYGRELMVPLVLASLLAFVLAPACALLQRLRLPRVLSVLLVVMFTFAVLGGLGTLVGHQAALLGKSLPAYRTTITGKWDALVKNAGFIERYTKDLAAPSGGDAKGAPPTVQASPMAALGLEDASGLSLARTVAQPILAPRLQTLFTWRFSRVFSTARLATRGRKVHVQRLPAVPWVCIPCACEA